MKKFSMLLLLTVLSGCVTYYTPEIVVEDGIYYASDDPAYINNAYVSGSYGYAGAAWYPWYSMDYFYLAYRPYGYWYSPWYYPYYSFYSPWYGPYYHHGLRPYGDWCQPYNACGRSKNDNYRGGGHRYVGHDPNSPTNRRNRGGKDEDGNEDPGDRRSGNQPGSSDTTPAATYTVYRTRLGGGEIHYRAGAKQGKSRTHLARTGVVTSTPSSGSSRVGTSSRSTSGSRSSGSASQGRRSPSGSSSSGRSSSSRSSVSHSRSRDKQ